MCIGLRKKCCYCVWRELCDNGDMSYELATKDNLIQRLNDKRYLMHTEELKQALKDKYGYDYDKECGKIEGKVEKPEEVRYDMRGINNSKSIDDMQYADIYEMFDNIFVWLEKFYRGDRCYFVVNKNGAVLHREESLTILPKADRERIMGIKLNTQEPNVNISELIKGIKEAAERVKKER